MADKDVKAVLNEIKSLCLDILDDVSPTINFDNGNMGSNDLAVILDPSVPLELCINTVIRSGSHFPGPEVGDLLRLKCLFHLEQENHFEAAMTALQGQGLLFRHQVIETKLHCNP